MDCKGILKLVFARSVLVMLPLIFSLLFLSDGHLYAGQYYEVGVTLDKLFRNPDQFCDYLEDHPSTFNSTFENCVNDNIQRRQNQIDQIWEKCVNLYTDKDQRTACFEQDNNGLDLENQIDYLEIMHNMTHGGQDCMLFYNLYGWMVDEWNATVVDPTWEELWDDQLENMKTGYACAVSDPDPEPKKKWYQCFIRSLLVHPSEGVGRSFVQFVIKWYEEIFSDHEGETRRRPDYSDSY